MNTDLPYPLKNYYPKLIDFEKAQLKSFLEDHDLRFEEDIEFAGCFIGRTARSSPAAAARKISSNALRFRRISRANLTEQSFPPWWANRFNAGISHLFIFSSPRIFSIFQNGGFFPLASTDTVVIMENIANGSERFLRPILTDSEKAEKSDPYYELQSFTLGHQYLWSMHRPDVTRSISSCEEDVPCSPLPTAWNWLKRELAHY